MKKATENIQCLILESDYYPARQIKDFVDRQPGYVVKGILDSCTHFESFIRCKPEIDLIISDAELADGLVMDVFDRNHIEISVIFYSAKDTHQSRCLKFNMVGFIPKPVTESQLTQTLKTFTTQKQLT